MISLAVVAFRSMSLSPRLYRTSQKESRRDASRFLGLVQYTLVALHLVLPFGLLVKLHSEVIREQAFCSIPR